MDFIDTPVKGGSLVGDYCCFFKRLPHFLMVSCGIGLETGEIPWSVLEILVKELLSGETPPEHLFTDFLNKRLKDLEMGASHII